MLKNGRQDLIVRMIKRLQAEANQILESNVRLAYFMRGAISYQEMM